MPRNETWERSGSFRAASPPAVSGDAWAKAAVPFDKTKAAHTTLATANRLRSELALASQVHISDPPSKILKQGNRLSSILAGSKRSPLPHCIPAHHFALEAAL